MQIFSFKRTILLSALALITSLSSNAQFKVVGYIPNYRQTALDNINYNFYTHLIASFINPDEQGVISWQGGDIQSFVSKVHAGGALAIISIGGGGDYSWGSKVPIYEDLLATPASRTTFVHNLMNYVRLHNLDGIDNDMEGQALALDNYNIFTQELADSLHAAGLEVSAAYGVGGNWGGSNVTEATLAKFDFVGTMSYGGVANWNWDDRDNYHSFEEFESDINYFKGRGMDAENVIGGVAYYTNEFPATQQSSYSGYNKTICATYQDARLNGIDVPNQDTIYTNEGSVIYLNSLNTFKRKIKHAKDNGGGIMIWESGQECFDGSISLSDTLYNYMQTLGLVTSTGKIDPSKIKVYPNPASNKVTIEGNNIDKVEILSIDGKIIQTEKFNSSAILNVDINTLSAGYYLIKLTNNSNESNTQKLVIK